MQNKKLFVVIVLLLVFTFNTTVFASLTLTTDAITGTSASTIDLGAGNALSLQTTGNGAINLGTGLVTTGGSLSVAGAVSAGGTAIDSSKYINVNVPNIDGVTTYGGYFNVAGNGGTLGSNETNLFGVKGVATRTSGAFTHGAVVGVAGQALLSSGQTTDNMVSLDGETQVQGTVNQAYGVLGQTLALGSGSIGSAYALYADTGVLNTSSITDAYGVNIKVRQFNTATITRAYGLALSGWAGTAGTSYGIYMDNSIDIGTTKYAIYSSSVSNSYLAGNVGIGKTNPGSKLSVVGLPAYADNGAALAGGLSAGDFYYTDTGGEYIVKIAH